MLRCPQCQFKNPDNHRFCQQCGASLNHKVCPSCGAGVAFDRQQCDECGADARVLWWAIVSDESGKLTRWSDMEAFPEYLDSQQRYCVLPPICGTQTASFREIQFRVLDRQPFQISQIHLCDRAIPYLNLQCRSNLTLPHLHDTWQQEGETVILLEDRSKWPLLVDHWGDRGLPMWHRLDWLCKMLDLWATLEVVACRQSLLELANLRLNEHQILCLQRLYPESEETAATLSALGQTWQALYQQSGQTLVGSMLELLYEMRVGKLETVEQVRKVLKQIVAESEEKQQDWVAAEAEIEEDDLSTIALPIQLFALEDAAQTDIGQRRTHNEDTFEIWTQIETRENPSGGQFSAKGLYILCDGMGGHDAGEVASALAARTLKQYFQQNWRSQFPTQSQIREAINQANQAIYEINQQEERSGNNRMGTTLAMVLIQDTQVAIAHVGDSRIYRLTQKAGLQQMSLDHEVAQQAILRGVDPQVAYRRADAHQLTQALGPLEKDDLDPAVQFLEIDGDTLFVLASDGLTDNQLLETHHTNYLNPLLNPARDLEQGVRRSIELANRENGHDNITVILIRARVRSN